MALGGAAAALLAALLVTLAAFYLQLLGGAGIGASFPNFTTHYVEQPAAGDFPKLDDVRNRLASAQPKFVNEIGGPESIAFDPQGRGPYTGLCDGRIVRWDGIETGWVDFAVTSSNRTSVCDPKSPPGPNWNNEHICGRPLGLRFKKETSELYIADAYFGLMVVGPEGGLATSLATEAEGEPLVFTNDLDFGDDGCVYFTDSSTKYQRRNFFLSILEGDVTGRLLKYDPATKTTSVLLRGLRFPNGVSASKDRSFIVFAESILGKLSRYWIKGPKAGTVETFAILPGHPDNVRTNSKGEFWVAMYGPRQAIMAFLGPRPKLRGFLLRLPIPVKYIYKFASGQTHGILLKYNEEGKLVDALEDRTGATVSRVSEAEEHDGHLWIGTVLANQMWVYNL